MQLREVLFQMRIVWSSEQESYLESAQDFSCQDNTGSTHDPRHIVMELHSSDIIEMSVESEETATVCRADVYAQ